MKSFGLLVASVTAVQAWQVLLYSGSNCAGSSYFILNAEGCRMPVNMPADFDAKSVQIIDVPKGKRVNVFTDANTGCDKLLGQNTKAFFLPQGGTECHDLSANKQGKWRILNVENAG